MKISNVNVIVFQILVLFLGVNFTHAQLQSISFYNTDDCSSKDPIQNGTFARNGSLPLNASNSDENVKAVKVTGLWQIDFCSTNCVSTILYNGEQDASCISELPTFSNVSRVDFTRFGTPSMREASDFIVYEEPNFKGTRHELTNESDVNIALKSYWFSGAANSWFIYSATNYTGNVTCLGPSASIQSSGMGFTYSLEDFVFNVRSIQRTTECPSNKSSIVLSSLQVLISCLILAVNIKYYFQ